MDNSDLFFICMWSRLCAAKCPFDRVLCLFQKTPTQCCFAFWNAVEHRHDLLFYFLIIIAEMLCVLGSSYNGRKECFTAECQASLPSGKYDKFPPFLFSHFFECTRVFV